MTMSPKRNDPRAATFAGYLQQAGNLPETAFIGVLAWFTISSQARLTPAEVEARFVQLGLDLRRVPPLIRPANAFRKATGPEAQKLTYTLADGHEARALLRDLPSDRDSITRVLIRERVDAKGKALDHVEVGRIVFYRERNGNGARLKFSLDDTRLQDGERAVLTDYLTSINAAYETYRDYLYDQPLRQMVREYIRDLNAIAVRRTGSVYFVHRSRFADIRKLTEFVTGLPACEFVTSPLLDLPEMHDMLVQAFQDEIVDEVNELLETVTAKGDKVTPEQVAAYAQSLQHIEARAQEHGRILEASQDRTVGALESAFAVLGALVKSI